jgi:hypothetical protein
MSARLLKRTAATLLLLAFPGVVPAEVSVRLNRDGSLKKVVYVVRTKGSNAGAWSQVKGYLPPALLLNPLGDNRGDLPPFIARHPQTSHPWVVWPRNIANQMRIGFAMWTGKGWTEPVLVTADPGPMFYNQLDPVLTFDASGVPYLVWWESGPSARVYFSTRVRDQWTPPLLLSEPRTDSRKPSVTLLGTDLVVSYATPSGPITRNRSAGGLVQSASQLMDSPIPPGNAPAPPGGPGGGEDGEERMIKK